MRPSVSGEMVAPLHMTITVSPNGSVWVTRGHETGELWVNSVHVRNDVYIKSGDLINLGNALAFVMEVSAEVDNSGVRLTGGLVLDLNFGGPTPASLMASLRKSGRKCTGEKGGGLSEMM